MPSDIGFGDTTLFLKWRLRVQDPDSWRVRHLDTLQRCQSSNESVVRHGYVQHIPFPVDSPLGRLPATRFGGLAFTEGLNVAKEYPAVPAHGSRVLYLHRPQQHGRPDHV